MGCAGCSLKTSDKTSCTTIKGRTCSCSRMTVYDWLADVPSYSDSQTTPVEVSFNNGARKSFFRVINTINVHTGDAVVVESDRGWDLGNITLSGELVKLQMRKHREKLPVEELPKVIRKASEQDREKLEFARQKQKEVLVRSRAIARQLELDMKIGDVEFQGDGRKATFYYTAENRVDFRELIKRYASEFKVKIDMRQIGMRQEAGRIGGIGSCGRELCCSSWLSDFSSVTTSAARYQNLAINQVKLSGQCGRLKCCLNYELDMYLEAWNEFPEKADRIDTSEGTAFLIKSDILKRLMHYKYKGKGQEYKLKVQDVHDILAMNARSEKPQSLSVLAVRDIGNDLNIEEDLVGQISLESIQKGRRKKGGYKGRNKRKRGNRNQGKGGKR